MNRFNLCDRIKAFNLNGKVKVTFFSDFIFFFFNPFGFTSDHWYKKWCLSAL